MGDAESFTPKQLQAARIAASLPERALIESLQSGETKCHNPAAWVEELEKAARSIEAGECDGNFTIGQRMRTHLTGQCDPLLAPLKTPDSDATVTS